ncbi:MAG: peptide transporter, periplasmic ligand binding protein [Acidobacteriaceae bacterium]|nr:peptide transporter, periplasmic ligand binding protein [Acidobacteriaceae bacterium]
MFKKFFCAAALVVLIAGMAGCARKPDPNTVVMIIESSPTNLDPRVGTDAYSERIGKLIFDSLVRRDDHFNLQPWVAERWEIPDPLTYVFHLRHDVRFHNGAPLTSRDVKWTLESMINGSVISAKTSTYKQVDRIEAPDDWTVIFHLKDRYASLLWNLSDGAFGIVPYGSGKGFNRAPIGSGPFRFVSAEQDNEVILERNDQYWGERAHIRGVRFAVIPDATTRALELRKGSADVAINSLGPDTVVALEKEPRLEVKIAPGTIYNYLAFNLRDPILRDVRVRQAIAYSIDRKTIIKYLWRDQAEPATNILPKQHWAYDADVRDYNFDPARARQILDEAGYRATNGVRFHLTMKTSTEETTRLLAAVLQQQLRDVGIALDIRSFEFATFYSDVVKGAFQLYSLRWIGGNEDPDIFENVFHSASFPPKRANRSYYVNPRVDALIDQGRRELDQQKRKQTYFELQKVLAEDVPYVHLWYLDNVIVYSKRLRNIQLSPSGNYDFLKTVELVP